MEKICKKCGCEFEITGGDLGFYEKIKVPVPTFCPTCREQRRLVFRNERVLFKRKCGLCGKNIVSLYGDDAVFPVYCPDCWWSDKWDHEDYGRAFDFSRPFFEQFGELLKVVPKISVLALNNENSDYNSSLAYSKNTYMSSGSYFMEDCYFMRKSQYCKDCLVSNLIDHCELVKSSINCSICYNCHDLINCRNCNDCAFMADCVGCGNCFMCSGINQKKYCYKNGQYSEDEYKKIVDEWMRKNFDELMAEFVEFSGTIVKKCLNLINCENCTGDYLQNCKNAKECYDCFDVEDCKYIIEGVNIKDSMDLNMHDKDIELCYELCTGGESSKNVKFSYCSCSSYDSDYLFSCFNSSNCFGCDGIHGKNSYCILNKKYSKDEYFEMRGRIVEHMKKTAAEAGSSTGEYGEFFPASLSLHGYNESVASDYYPLGREEAIAQGFKWKEKDKKEYSKSDYVVPDNIADVSDDIVNAVLSCKDCGKNYKILEQELDLCRRMKVPLSKKCSYCRHLDLLKLKNPRKLWERKCAKCGAEIQSSYSPERPEKVYCEKCYLKKVY